MLCFKFGSDYLKPILNLIENKFRLELMNTWIQFTRHTTPKSWIELPVEPVWYNRNIKVGGKSVNYNNFIDRDLLFLSMI